MLRSATSAVLAGILVALLATPAFADGSAPGAYAPPPPAASDVVGDDAGLSFELAPVYGSASGGWAAPRSRFELSMPVWVPGVTGTLATGTQEASTDGSFFDRFIRAKETISELQFAFVGRIEGTWKRWWGLVDAYAARIGTGIDWTNLGANTSVELEAFIGRAVVGYEAWRVPAYGQGGACFTFTPYLGVRYVDIDLQINAAAGSHDWVDGIVGLEMRWWLAPRWNLRVLADIGTGLGDGSDLCWTAAAEVHFRVARWFSLFVGYSVLSLDYDRDEGNRFVVDVTLAGPQLGFTIHF